MWTWPVYVGALLGTTDRGQVVAQSGPGACPFLYIRSEIWLKTAVKDLNRTPLLVSPEAPNGCI